MKLDGIYIESIKALSLLLEDLNPRLIIDLDFKGITHVLKMRSYEEMDHYYYLLQKFRNL